MLSDYVEDASNGDVQKCYSFSINSCLDEKEWITAYMYMKLVFFHFRFFLSSSW